MLSPRGQDSWRAPALPSDSARPPALYLQGALNAYLVYGGIVGLDAVVKASQVLIRTTPAGGDVAGGVLWICLAVLFAQLVYAGLGLQFGWRAAWITATAGQAAQVFMFASSFGGFVFSSGLFAGVLLEGGAWSPFYGWAIHAEIGTQSHRHFIGVNIVPLAILTVLYQLRRMNTPRGPRGSVARRIGLR